MGGFYAPSYKTNNKDSDIDYLCIYNNPLDWNTQYLPNIHQFQYTSTDNIDYIYTSEEQFWKNQKSGDSTINSDVIMFSNNIIYDETLKLKYCRTYKVIKAYLGFAKRDLKMIGKKKNKLFHAERSLYVSNSLIKNTLPSLSIIQNIRKNPETKEWCIALEKELREEVNFLFEKKELENYYIREEKDSLLNILVQSNNTREFRYE